MTADRLIALFAVVVLAVAALVSYVEEMEVYKDDPEWGSEVVWPSRIGHLQSDNLRVFMADVLRRFW